MASVVSTMVLYLLLLLLLLNQSSAVSVVEQSCSSTKYPEICVTAFKQDPRSAKATNNKELSRIGIELSASKSSETLLHVSKLVSGSTDYPEWAKLRQCEDVYNSSTDRLAHEALRLFDQGNFSGARDSVASLNSAAVQCNEMDLPLLADTNNFLLRFSDSVMAIIRALY